MKRLNEVKYKRLFEMFCFLYSKGAINFQKLIGKLGKLNKLFLSIIILLMMAGSAFAETIDVNKLADAIYKAEGGSKTSHPYGILAKYKHTTPRQACINTINHALRDWDGNGEFIRFLGNRYCPVGAANDPTGLNKNWIGNVKYFYNR